MINKIQLSQVLPKLQRVKEYEKYYSSLCPMHEDNKPSFLLYKDGWYRCLGCGRTGDLYSLHRFLSGWTSKSMSIRKEIADFRAPRIPENSEEFALDAHETLVNFSESLSWYLRLRGLDQQIDAQKIGWYNGWYTFPVYGYEDEYRGLILRAGQHIQEATNLRYIIKSTGSLYFPDWYLARTGKYLVVTFGILDAITLTALRIPACSTTHGKNMNVEELDWVRKPILFFPDEGEDHEAREHARQLGWRGHVLEYEFPDGMKDVNDLHKAGKDTDICNAIGRALSSTQTKAGGCGETH